MEAGEHFQRATQPDLQHERSLPDIPALRVFAIMLR